MPDLDVAVEVCRVLPRGYTTETRPVVEIEGSSASAEDPLDAV